MVFRSGHRPASAWTGSSAAPRSRARVASASSAPRRHHDRDVRDRARDGGRASRVPAPVLVAAVDAFLDPASGSAQLQAASGSAFPVVVVNGPIGAQIRRTPASAASARSAAARGRQHRSRASSLAGRTSAAPCPGSAPWPTTVACATRTSSSPKTRESAAGLGDARQRASRVRAGPEFDLARLRERRHQHPPPRRSRGNAGGRRCRACTAWPISCECPTCPASRATSTARRAS